MDFSLIIAVRNEEENLKVILKDFDTTLFKEIILVDGNSSDKSIEVSKSIIPTIKIHHQIGIGKGSAMLQGAEIATSPYLIFIDADGSMDPKEISLIQKYLQEDFDLVKGTRRKFGGKSDDITLFRSFGNIFFTYLTNLLFSTKFSDLCYGYFGVKKLLLLNLDLQEKHFGIEAEIAIKSKLQGANIIEFPSHERNRLFGSSKLNSIKDGYEILKCILKCKLKN